MKETLSYFPRIIKYILFATVLTPIIYSNKTFYPYILGKTVFFRGFIEIALLATLFYLALKIFYKETLDFSKFRDFLKNPLVIFLSLFLISIILSVLFAVDKYTAFWGNFERGEGFFGLIHFFIFFLLTAIFFERKDWLLFFKFSLIVGFLTIFYGFLQYFKVNEFPFALEVQERPGSFIGNPAFLSAYLFLVSGISILILNFSKNLFWRVFSFIVVLLSIMMFFIAATRGALLGFAAGLMVLLFYYAFRGRSKKIKLFSLLTLFLFLILIFTFWFTRGNSFWLRVPGLNRLSQITFVNSTDSTMQTRLLTWQVGWNSFKQKPIFGWGMENFLVAWNENYNPNIAVYGETWLDRAHNKLVDVLVMQGAVGFLAYLFLFGAVFYFLFSNKKKSFGCAPILGGIFTMYFVQNLFLFDEINSYLLFFGTVGFMASANIFREKGEEKTDKEISTEKDLSVIRKSIFYVFAVALGILIIVSLYFLNYIPYAQGKNIQLAKGGQKDFVKGELIKSFYPYNFIQPSIRAYIADFYYQSQPQIFESDDFKILSDLVLISIDEVLAHDSYDPRFYIRKNQILDVLGQRNEAFYKESEKAARDALKLAPNRHEIWYALALSLGKQGKIPEALELAKKIIDLSPKAARPHFYYAFLLSVSDIQKNKEEILAELDEVNKLDPALNTLQPSDIKPMAEIYFNLKEYDKLADLIFKKVSGNTPKTFESQYYQFALRYFITKRDLGKFVKTAEFISKEFPDTKNDMDTVIDLAKKGLWHVLDTLP